MPDQNLTTAELGAIERLEKEATPGPWHREYLELKPGGMMTLGIGSPSRPVCIVNGIVESPPGLRDVAFITQLRNAAPALIAAARRSLEQDERIRELEQRLAAALARPAGKGRTLERAPLIIGDDDGEETPNAG